MAGDGTGDQNPTPTIRVIFSYYSATLPSEWLCPLITNVKINEMWRALWGQGIEYMEEAQTMYVFMYVCIYFWWSNKISHLLKNLFLYIVLSICSSYIVSSHSSYRVSLVAQLVKNTPAMWETWVRSLGWEDPLEKGTATHSRILTWRIPWTV